jgi:tryptophan synthase beta chain
MIEKIELLKEENPRNWYNIIPDLSTPLPPYLLNRDKDEFRCLPKTFTKMASSLEFSQKRNIQIPEGILDAYIQSGRPRPLIRARRLEASLGTPVKIFYKCEDISPGYTFKTNTALAQAFWAMKEGYANTVFAGSALTRTKIIHAYAARKFGLKPTIVMPKKECRDYPEQVQFLKKMLDAIVIESTSRESMMEKVASLVMDDEDSIGVYSTFLNHILMTQTIIGLEVEKQLDSMGLKPDILIAPVGGGSNLYGLISPFIGKLLKENFDLRILAVESETSSKLRDGIYSYVQMSGLLKGLYAKTFHLENNKSFTPIVGKGIQVSRTAPILSLLNNLGFLEPVVYPKDEKVIYEAARIFLKTEGHLIAPESAYAVRAAIDEALIAKKENKKKLIVLSISGTMNFDFDEKQRYLTI